MKRTARTQELASAICERMADRGMSILRTCADLGISKPFVLDWAKDDEAFAAQYAYARDMLTEFYAEEIVEIADNEPDPTKARVMVDARKWIVSKLLPKKYGDRPADVNVQAITHVHISADRQKELQERRAKALARS